MSDTPVAPSSFTDEELDEHLSGVLTKRQLEALKLYSHLGAVRAVARELACSERTVSVAVHKAAQHGVEFRGSAAPSANVPGMATSKTTVQYDAHGNVVNEWRRMLPCQEELEEWVAAIAESVKGVVPRIAKPKTRAKRQPLMLEIPIMDLHLSKLSWWGDTHEVYDTDIATELAVQAVSSVLYEAGPVEKVLLVFGGDTLQTDNRMGITEASSNSLDVDTRFARMVQAACDLLTTAVSLCHQHCGNVEVIVTPGNHDWHSAHWLQQVLSAAYARTPTVCVRTDPYPRQYVEYGVNLIGFAHGNNETVERLVNVMPVEQPEMWARTKYRYWHTGHFHRSKRHSPVEVDERQGVTVEFLRSLCAADAWHVEKGYVGNARALTTYLWHAKYGPRGTIIRSAEELAELMT